MEIAILIFIIIFFAIFMFVILAKNKYKNTGVDGLIKQKDSSALLERIEESKNLMQIDKARLDLQTKDIPNTTKEALFFLLKLKREQIIAKQEYFELNDYQIYKGYEKLLDDSKEIVDKLIPNKNHSETSNENIDETSNEGFISTDNESFKDEINTN